jgi:protein-S-isoprenylcysteine O-methyltransferase Ste14
MAAQFILPAFRNPTLLRERTAVAGNTKRWDRLLMPITVVVLPLVALVVAGLDTRFGWTVPFPPIVRWIAAALGIGAYSLTLVSMMSNPFLSNVVRIQIDRGHQVHSKGPYERVRHPGYVGMIGPFAAVRARNKTVVGDADSWDVRPSSIHEWRSILGQHLSGRARRGILRSAQPDAEYATCTTDASSSQVSSASPSPCSVLPGPGLRVSRPT